MKISEMITDRYKLRIPPTVYYELLADVVEAEEEQEPTTKNDLGVDCISRAEAIKCLGCDFDITGKENMKIVVNYINSAHDKIMNLPRVKQAPKTGHWIDDMRLGYHVSICSNCNWRGHGDTCLIYKTKYCPNCGAKMVELLESEDKE